MKIILLILVNRDHNSEIMTKFAVYWVRTALRFFLRKKDGDSLYNKTDGDSSYARRQEIHLTHNWAHHFFLRKNIKTTMIERLLTVTLLSLASLCSWAGEVTVTWSASSQGYSNGQKLDGASSSIDPLTTVSFAQNGGSNPPAYYDSGLSVRIYGGGSLTVSGSNMVKIVLGFGESDKTNEIRANVGTYNGGSWSGNANEVVFSVEGTSGHRRISSVEVTYVVADGVLSAPTLTAPYTFWPKTTETPNSKVTITPVTAGSTVYYTTDGSEPTLESDMITEPTEVRISGTTTVKAKSVMGGQESETVIATYTLGRTVNSIAEFKQIGEGSEARLYLSDSQNARVLYTKGNETYLRDKSGAICLYLSPELYNPKPAHNQHVAGWIIGRFHDFNGLPEFVATSNTTTNYILFAEPVSEPVTRPEEIDAEEFGAYYADWVLLKDLDVTADESGITLEKEGFSFELYNKFELADGSYILPETGSVVNVSGIATPYGGKDEVVPVSIDGYAPVEVVKEPTAIVGVSADETSGTAGFYTIAGQRVSHPSKGLYIVNGKKVFIK